MKDSILQGDSLTALRTIPDEFVDCIVTSPPYYGLRDYGENKQIGLEDTPELYIDNLVSVFREARRVLKKEGTLWLNLGDSYQDKSLMMIPARVAMALQADGWYLRSDIIWYKPNCMPESVKDRPTNDFEHVFLLTKNLSYFYDVDKLREPHKTGHREDKWQNNIYKSKKDGAGQMSSGYKENRPYIMHPKGGNKRAVWAISTKPYAQAHFAIMPTELADTCVKAGCPKGGIVLDPFGGAGTTAIAALQNFSHYLLIELNADYIKLAEDRINQQRLEGIQLGLGI